MLYQGGGTASHLFFLRHFASAVDTFVDTFVRFFITISFFVVVKTER